MARDTGIGIDIRVTLDSNIVDEVNRDIEQSVFEYVSSVGETAKGYAQEFAPFRTGRLHDSIDYVVEDRNTFILMASAPYAAAVELGTFQTPARPYMLPAVELIQDSFVDGLEQVIVDALPES